MQLAEVGGPAGIEAEGALPRVAVALREAEEVREQARVQPVQEGEELRRPRERRRAGEDDGPPGRLEQREDGPRALGLAVFEVVALVRHHHAAPQRRDLGAELVEQVVGDDGHGAAVQPVAAGEDDVDVRVVHEAREPAEELLAPHHAHGARAHDERRPVGEEGAAKRDGLDGLAQAHLVPDEHPPALAERKLHPGALKRHEALAQGVWDHVEERLQPCLIRTEGASEQGSNAVRNRIQADLSFWVLSSLFLHFEKSRKQLIIYVHGKRPPFVLWLKNTTKTATTLCDRWENRLVRCRESRPGQERKGDCAGWILGLAKIELGPRTSGRSKRSIRLGGFSRNTCASSREAFRLRRSTTSDTPFTASDCQMPWLRTVIRNPTLPQL